MDHTVSFWKKQALEMLKYVIKEMVVSTVINLLIRTTKKIMKHYIKKSMELCDANDWDYEEAMANAL